MLKSEKRSGFTLAELLIALTILAEIATFSIPKLLSSQQYGANNANAKETVAMLSGAYQEYFYAQRASVAASTTMGALTPYMNFVSVDTSSVIDSHPSVGTAGYACTSSDPCLRLHNGAAFSYSTTGQFCASDGTGALRVEFDPDGQYTNPGTADAPGKSIILWLYADGSIRTSATVKVGTQSQSTGLGCTTWNPQPTKDPSWFSW